MKILAVRAELLHADRQIDRQRDAKKLIVAFRNIGNAPNNCYCISGNSVSITKGNTCC